MSRTTADRQHLQRIAFAIRALGSAIACIVVVGWPASARAWLETQVRSANIRIEVQDADVALVQHEMMLKVRGGPLRHLTIDGVDRDAEVVGNSTLVRARSGKVAGAPMRLVSQRAGERLHLELVYRRGVRGGTYLIRFAYRTHLKRVLTDIGDGQAELRWRSPAYADGIDSLRVTFSLPESKQRPYAVGGDPEKATDLVARDDGVFLSEWRNSGERDVLSLTRPHAAKGQRIEWAVTVDPAALSATPAAVAPSEPKNKLRAAAAGLEQQARAAREIAHTNGVPSARSWLWLLLCSVAVAGLYAGLVALRAKVLGSKPIVPANVWVRSLFIVLALALAGLLGGTGRLPAVCALCLLLTLVLAVQRELPDVRPVQGKGYWKSVHLGSVRLAPSNGSRWGRCFQASRFPGLLFLVSSLSGVGIAALRALGNSGFQAVFIVLLGALVFPLFFSVGAERTQAASAQRCFLSELARVLVAKPPQHIVVRAIARFAEPDSRCEELRLHVALKRARSGALGIEVGVESFQMGLTSISYPVIVVRVRDGSPAHQALPPSDLAAEGREPTERVALFRPSLPTVETTRALMAELCELLNDNERQAPRSLRGTAQPNGKVRSDKLRRAS